MTASSEHRGRRVAMPDVVGLDIRDATAVLQNGGIRDFRVRYTETYADERVVVEQEPRGGLLIERGRAIILSVCRRNMVQYLPQVFQQSAPDGSFLRGYLYIVQQISDSVASHIAHAYELFDPRTAREDFLPWLASWLAITLSPDWDDLQRRQMLLAATRLFPFRGTAYSIREFVRIYTGAQVTVEENAWPYEGFRIGVSSDVGLDTVILPPMNLAHCFVVRLDRSGQDVTDEEIIKIHQIIQLQKPAHTSYFLAFQDETDGGEMAVFVEVGSGSIGVGDMGGIGIGVAAAEPMLETAAEPEPKPAPEPGPRSKGRTTKPEPAAPEPAPRRVKASRARKGDESKAPALDEEAPTSSAGAAEAADDTQQASEAGAARAAKREARRKRTAEAEAARAVRKGRAEQRAVERVERSRTDIKAITDEDLAVGESTSSTAKDTKAKDTKVKDAKAGDADAERKASSNEGRERRAAAAAEREARKARAKGRAAERAERSRTDIKAISDEDLADDGARKAAPSTGTAKAKPKKAAKATGTRAKGKDASGAGAESDKEGESAGDASKREARRKRTADAAAARKKRKDDAAKRAGARDAKKGGAGKGASGKGKTGGKGGKTKK